MPTAIKTENLCKSFGPTRAVEGLSLEVAEGELFGLVGPDGAGKTTVLRLLAALLPPTAGDAWVAGRHVVREAEAVHEAIGYVPQRFSLYPDLTVDENVAFFADLYGVARRERGERTARLLAWSRLEPFRRRLAGNLSGGMKQKLGLACALIHTPKVLLLDEPTNGVDPVSRREFWGLLRPLLAEGVTIFVSTSYLDEADRCGRVALLQEGRLLACAPPEEVKALAAGSVLEIRTSDPRRALGILRSAWGEGAATLFGDRIHALVGNATAAAARARSALGDAGVEVQGIREARPGLEDAFVSIVSASRKPTSTSGESA
ncbi:MAG: ABC transporter ATP-binding protein [Planctomycetes bacterium]|nr:ABC transporter ATP-binding protein [Planctomycetota bacterium]